MVRVENYSTEYHLGRVLFRFFVSVFASEETFPANLSTLHLYYGWRRERSFVMFAFNLLVNNRIYIWQAAPSCCRRRRHTFEQVLPPPSTTQRGERRMQSATRFVYDEWQSMCAALNMPIERLRLSHRINYVFALQTNAQKEIGGEGDRE